MRGGDATAGRRETQLVDAIEPVEDEKIETGSLLKTYMQACSRMK
jgi:hypothetical protein